MLLFGLVTLAVCFLALAIWWLQRHERQNRLDSVERSSELPPLTTSDLPDFSRAPPPAAVAIATIAASPATAPVAPAPATLPAIGFALTPPDSDNNRPEPASNLWQDQVKKLRDKGDFELALVLCQQNFPKSQAFQQAAIVLRLQMKQSLDQQQDLSALLARLYRCAVLADLFRSGAALKPSNARQALKALAPHEFQYQEVGHRQLKLLSKSDARLLEQRWGEPARHQHAEAALGPLWENVCR